MLLHVHLQFHPGMHYFITLFNDFVVQYYLWCFEGVAIPSSLLLCDGDGTYLTLRNDYFKVDRWA